MNAPNRFELHVLQDGEQKLGLEEDTKIPNAATFTVNKEDHTLANMLRSQLLLLPYVLFAGYKVPHPLEPRFIIKVQTDSTHTPVQAIQDACKELILTIDKMKKEVHKEMNLYRIVGPQQGGMDQGGVGDGAGAFGMGGLDTRSGYF